ncbi:BapA/Bap/LapF family prefix-like domain-containing protein [Pseudomonas sp. KNUC1026]|uniref:BapA/Bap/LapF family prefix-like domain-containing protein n=1 Tax=Pseudomonas sp. KNUC1026 TaxID=2893890 RepID=UPI001F2C5205|nr:hypothetical protein [Pseudomonas sp. KNUC1026]UFH51526.1 hypothetical protein LN139_11450 [Pseudomonas sp. KNUC1026]
MDNIVVADKASEQISESAWGNVNLNTPGVVKVPASRNRLPVSAAAGRTWW